jgi:hypothetical protein
MRIRHEIGVHTGSAWSSFNRPEWRFIGCGIHTVFASNRDPHLMP